MKLILSDFEYLGINVLDYSKEEIVQLIINLDPKDLINELFNEKNIERSSIACSDIWEGYKYKLYNDIYVALGDIYYELEKVCTLEEGIKNCYMNILEGIIELREKDINTVVKENRFRHPPEIKIGVEILDEDLSKCAPPYFIPNILKERNIERLKELFKEKNI